MITGPFLSFFGGKWRATPRLYPVPRHRTIIEPFAGSAGYSLRYYYHQVILYEKDPLTAAVWDYLIRASTKDILALPLMEDDQTIRDLPCCEEAQNFIGWKICAGQAKPYKTKSSWARSGARPNTFWGEKVREKMAAQIECIDHWKIHNMGYEEIPHNRKATYFIDPPYQYAGGEHYRCGAKDINYGHLAHWCKSRQGQVIVCEGKGADWLPFRPLGRTKTTMSNVDRGSKGEGFQEMGWIR